MKIDELEAHLKDPRDKLEEAIEDRDDAIKDVQNPSWKLVAKLKGAEDIIKRQAWKLARFESKKGRYQKLTPPNKSEHLTMQEELITDLTSGLILLSKWCGIKDSKEEGLQTKHLKELLADPDGFHLQTALQTISLLVRQISFLNVHLVTGHNQGPGNIQHSLHFDLEALSDLISQEQHLAVEEQIDYNCLDPQGFQRIDAFPPTPTTADHRRGLQDYLYSEYWKEYQQETDLAIQSSSTTQTCTRVLQDNLFEAAQLETFSQSEEHLDTSEDPPSTTGESPEASQKPSSSS